jgi:hypothetical protein
MMRLGLILACAAAIGAPLAAQLPPLPVPLTLPPDLIEVLPVDTGGTYMGDAVRIVDCPDNADNPFGVCGNLLFGGLAMWNTHLTGAIQIKFFPPINNISHFQISHPFNLRGPDVLMKAPQLYVFSVTQNILLDTFNNYSTGDLNLNTGEVTNLAYAVNFFNFFYEALGLVNPKLKAPAFTFPGIYGSANASFKQRPDGLLDFTFYGSTFLPLGNNINGDPVRLPMPFCGPLDRCASIQVPGMSLHPHLSLTTIPSSDPPCQANCYTPPYDSVIQLTLNARFADFGDDFTLNIPQLGGTATGRSQLQGRIQMQFGDQNGDYVPVAINSMPPAALLVPPPAFPINGLSLGFLGFDEHLNFPRLSYEVTGTAITDDPFDVPVGEFNVRTGQFVGELRWRSFWNQSLLLAILAQNNGRLLPASFMIHGPAQLQTGPNGEILFRYNGSVGLPFDSFTWPAPDYTNAAASFIAGPGSLLTPFFRMQAVLPTDIAGSTAVITGSQSNVQSSWGDVFSYSYSIPCDAAGKTSSFTYTDTNSGSRGGTFTMTNLASATCFNSLTSTQRPGNYDTVVFTGYGKWSKDSNPHIANVQVSTASDAPYVAISIDGGTLSNVNTKPPQNPVP